MERDILENATILHACRATSAAPTYFEPLQMTFGPKGSQYISKFIDGGLGFNNPVEQLWNQATTVWQGPIDKKVDCLVSIGTGDPVVPDYDEGVQDLGRRLLSLATDSRNTAQRFYELRRYDLGRKRYFRFNVLKGLESIQFGEARQKDRIIEVTKAYLVDDGEVYDKVTDCSTILKRRDCTSAFA